MTRRKRRILIAAGALLAYAVVADRLETVIDFTKIPCSASCTVEEIDAGRCVPLKLDLEIANGTVKAGERYTLWHRITLKNDSCVRLEFFQGKDFLYTKGMAQAQYSNRGLWLRILGPDGKEIKPRDDLDRGGYAQVHPYTDDEEAFEQIKKRLSWDQNWNFNLPPSAEVRTIPSKLQPHRVLPGIHLVEGMDKQAFLDALVKDLEKGLKPIEEYRFESPPAGFRSLDNYVFDRPGRYTVQAVYAGERFVKPLYRWRDRIPNAIQNLLLPGTLLRLALGDLLGKKPHEDPYGYWRDATARSEIFTFEVVR